MTLRVTKKGTIRKNITWSDNFCVLTSNFVHNLTRRDYNLHYSLLLLTPKESLPFDNEKSLVVYYITGITLDRLQQAAGGIGKCG